MAAEQQGLDPIRGLCWIEGRKLVGRWSSKFSEWTRVHNAQGLHLGSRKREIAYSGSVEVGDKREDHHESNTSCLWGGGGTLQEISRIRGFRVHDIYTELDIRSTCLVEEMEYL
ncbi:hypothetical protein Tco_0624446 [Tanacetum coccineum]|uniref:Uncharacterized protein n=1 Tax=Tanacetum coccineum TaxID=301880 RepID=A0ABQ4WDZ6_9ASTR